MTTILTTDMVGANRRESFWRDAMSQTFVPLTVVDIEKDRFGGSIRSNWVGRLMIAEVASTAQDIRRTERLISRDDADYFQIALIEDGVGRVAQDGREAVLRRGDCAVYETMRPFEWQFDADWRATVLTLPRGSVQLTDAQRRLLTARRLDASAGLTGVMSRFLIDVARNSEQLSGARAERVLVHATDLVLALLEEHVDDCDAARSSVQRSLMLRIKDHIERHLRDADLSPTTIAAAASISTRYLHKLFEAEAQSVATYVRRRRLDRCRHELLDPRCAERPISDIAFRWGFNDLSAFNRAFKAVFGITPRELRASRPSVMR
jgi:AraC-like DNA-binding protein